MDRKALERELEKLRDREKHYRLLMDESMDRHFHFTRMEPIGM
ncbi:MAG: hypothetical protein WBG37_11650 [Desulfobacterales bacterium]